MALKKTVITPQEFEALDAYHRVEKVRLVSKNTIEFCIVSYKNNETKIQFNLDTKQCLYNLNGENPIKQAYEYLKTLPEFSDAIDC